MREITAKLLILTIAISIFVVGFVSTSIPEGNGSINGTKDYRLWKFIDNPGYVTIKPGVNKLTAKYSCFPNSDPSNNKQPTFVKYHSINVTGI